QKEAEPTAAELIAAAHAAGTEFHYITSDTLVSLGATALTIFAPVSAAAENDRGLAVLAADGGFETLITGDMAAPTEQLLLGLKNLPDIEVLVVGHHGSADATAEALLTAVKPEAGLISVGKNNGYGHPSPSTLQRLEAAGVTVFRTDKMGSISITTQGEITYGG
ncbi:MAG: ComEC/Rec2 family competence protein, partial [bacterium]